MEDTYYSPSYDNSLALIIGINQYQSASPLEYAVSDAKAVAEILEKRFDFEKENIKILIDENATRKRIMSSFMSFTNDGVNPNDKIFIFFAGHGLTQTGRRGEVGFLIPYDGTPKDLSSLIRWDDLTRNAELIPAKHILFIMDACYGGLAITRTLSAGSMRFLKDMLQRHVTQVLTAGKANEVVADAGGPVPNHSVFTGHFLQGLQGRAASDDGVITANGVMAYVYDRVAKDPHSQQTPHYGLLDGDGDFIFEAPNLSGLTEEEKVDKDVLISIPSTLADSKPIVVENLIEATKEYLSDNRHKIKLHDLVSQKLREVVALLSEEHFEVQGGNFNEEEFTKKIKLYEDVTREIQSMASCISYWGGPDHYQLLSKILARVCDNLEPKSGLVVWLKLRWYPVFLILYSAGISAVASNNYGALSALLTTQVQSPNNTNKNIEVTLPIGEAAADLHDVFKRLPGHEKHYVPRSEYFFKMFQPNLDDLLFLGRDYERVFDRFETILALVYADLDYKPGSEVWGPIGRFGWKYRKGGLSGNVYGEIVEEAKKLNSEWPPLKAGLFSGSIGRFLDISSKFEELLKSLHWM